MDYDLYTTDDRRYARVIQPDDGDSLSGSSYTGSDASNAPGHSPADVVKEGKILSSSQPFAEAEASVTGDGESMIHEAESGIGISSAPGRPHDLLVPIHNALTGPSPEISREDLGQEEDQISTVGGHNISSTVTEEDGSTHGPIQTGDFHRQGHEETADATSEVTGPSEHGLGAGTLSQNRGAHSASEHGVYSKLGSAMDLPDNGSGVSERIVPNRDVGQGFQAGSSRRTTLSAGYDPSGRRSPPLERARSNSVHSNRDTREIILPRWQPDAEVTYCPICRTQFSFFVRKHHCRYAPNLYLTPVYHSISSPGAAKLTALKEVWSSCLQFLLASPYYNSISIYSAATPGCYYPI